MGRRRKRRRNSADDGEDYTPNASRSEEEKAERKRACGRKYYAQHVLFIQRLRSLIVAFRHPEYREAKRLRMQVIRQSRKAARRRWDPPKASGYAADADEALDEEDGYEASLTAPTPRLGPSPTVRAQGMISEIVGESYDGQLPTLWQQKLNEIRAQDHAESGEREELEVDRQLVEKERIASQVLSSLYKRQGTTSNAIVCLPRRDQPSPPSSPPPLSTPDLDFAPRATAAGDWTSSPMTSIPIATPSPIPPPRRRQADAHARRGPLPRWKTPDYDGPEEMPPLEPRKLFADLLRERQAHRRAGRG
ncbi:hypothetical protein R3P38DRAFT_2775418 [Favolaschia claudopus]|uniref:Uncharacterized protein n=1 Tax=Favolaschia claudopus TaxID=2862362 RepID=A0AAW0BV49_9AGAR